MEFDRKKLPASIDVAEKAILQRLRALPIAESKEHLKLKDALGSLSGSKENALAHYVKVQTKSPETRILPAIS